ncbi:MAG: type II toxin-antitoxin system PemK/MazF family toxin [Parvularculaceae bacterium]
MKKPIATFDAFGTFDVVVVPFPYADRLAEKRRPALVVSVPKVTTNYGLVWLVMITSAANPRLDYDVVVNDLDAAGLPAPSLVRPVKIATVDSRRIIRTIGNLGAADVNCVKINLLRLIGAQ